MNMISLAGLVLLIAATIGSTQCKPTEPVRLIGVNLNTQTNTLRHHTDKYLPTLVFRRGEHIDVSLRFDRPINNEIDKLRLEFALGRNAQFNDSSLIYLPVTLNSTGKFQLKLPPTLAVGQWRLSISTRTNDTTRRMLSFPVGEFYVVLNPWNKQDDVYMHNEDARREYVLQDVGKIYVGTYATPIGRKWTYDQFDPSVLVSVMTMLDRYKMSLQERSSAVSLSRAVSAMANSHDDMGLLVGNWSGNYGDGSAPWQWTGSAGVFRTFVKQNFMPVKFGQCWVFGGVTTTSLRALGIPARAITNFVSAHDTDMTMSVDKFYSDFGEEKGINSDSIWNFHVWSDAWMARHDLPPGFGGWQAVDGTPQEKSMGRYQLGPASLEAIKQGRVDYGYDVGFVYSEVNADIVYWRLDRNREWKLNKIDLGHNGRQILTKKIGMFEPGGTRDAENIADHYKYSKDTPEAKVARSRAIKGAGMDYFFQL